LLFQLKQIFVLCIMGDGSIILGEVPLQPRLFDWLLPVLFQLALGGDGMVEDL
jgi:hypothetical protein